MLGCSQCPNNKLLFYQFQGYQGMVDGGNNIVEAAWEDVSGIMQMVKIAFNFSS